MSTINQQNLTSTLDTDSTTVVNPGTVAGTTTTTTPSSAFGGLPKSKENMTSYEREIVTKPIDYPRIERAVREILAAVGEDPDREGLLETPGRVARMYAEMFAGLRADPKAHLQKVFTENYDEVVLIKDITFCSMCEHHLLPFTGRAHVGYLPNGKVVGLSKLARVVEDVARRPQVQERMTEHIANLIETELGTRGVAVVLEASHSCMTIRGIRKPGSTCMTSSMRGVFRDNLSTRAEILGLILGERK